MMEHLIPMMNNIHTILKKAGLDDEIELPRFVVIGSQSVGKSSVLESIAGFGFLPRGDGLVTRCPLIMQLVNSNSQKPYAVFNHKPNEKMFDFDKVKEEILRQTNILAGEGGNIVEDEITVTIYSKSVVNLTLIDLPGFIQFSMEDQSDDLPEQIKQLVEKYICKENTLILAIHPAGVDIANSEPLQFAKQFDEKGERTLCVLTKVDLMNEGTNVLKLLNGDQNPLNHGYIAVKGRSQKDINEGKTIELGLADEIKFFENNPDYSAISHRQGVKYLSRKISLIMHNHIKKQLPNIRKKIDERYSKDLKRIEAISLQKEFETDNDAHKWIIDRIADYCKIYTELIDGTSVQKSTEELKGGAKIYATIEKSFRKHIDKMDPFDYLTDKEIRTSIISVRGVKPELMIPEEAARILIKQQIARLAEPCEQCCQLVHCELVKIIKLPKYDEFKKYIKLMDFIEQTMANLLETYMNKVIVIIKNIIAGESNHINFDHDDFIYLKPYCLLLSKINEHDLKRVVDTLKIDPAYFEDDNDNLNFDESQEIVNDNQLEDDSPDHATILLSERDMEYMPSYNPNNNININSRPTILRRVREKLEVRDEATQKEEMQVIIMKRLIVCYFSIIKKQIKDIIPKQIIYHLIEEIKSKMLPELSKALLSIENKKELLEEDLDIKLEKEKLKESNKSLSEAKKLLDKFFNESIDLKDQVNQQNSKKKKREIKEQEKRFYDDQEEQKRNRDD